MNNLAFSLFGDWAGVAKGAEWLAGIFAFLAWATGHPSTAAWAIGFVVLLAVFREGWPFKGVPGPDTFLGKALVMMGMLLIVGGFGWRAADEIFGSHPVASQKTHEKAPSGQSDGTSAPVKPKVPGAWQNNG